MSEVSKVLHDAYVRLPPYTVGADNVGSPSYAAPSRPPADKLFLCTQPTSSRFVPVCTSNYITNNIESQKVEGSRIEVSTESPRLTLRHEPMRHILELSLHLSASSLMQIQRSDVQEQDMQVE